MNDEKSDRPMFDTTCSECGQETQVPFQPSGDRPVYCNDCFRKKRSGGGGGYDGPRQMYDATCATCGEATQVPFKPSGDRPIYCREHYEKNRE